MARLKNHHVLENVWFVGLGTPGLQKNNCPQKTFGILLKWVGWLPGALPTNNGACKNKSRRTLYMSRAWGHRLGSEARVNSCRHAGQHRKIQNSIVNPQEEGKPLNFGGVPNIAKKWPQSQTVGLNIDAEISISKRHRPHRIEQGNGEVCHG